METTTYTLGTFSSSSESSSIVGVVDMTFRQDFPWQCLHNSEHFKPLLRHEQPPEHPSVYRHIISCKSGSGAGAFDMVTGTSLYWLFFLHHSRLCDILVALIVVGFESAKTFKWPVISHAAGIFLVHLIRVLSVILRPIIIPPDCFICFIRVCSMVKSDHKPLQNFEDRWIVK